MAKALRNLGDLCNDRKQRLHILTLYCLPSWIKVCLCTLALNRVLVCRLEWLTLLPLIPDFRQSSHLIIRNCFLRTAAFLGLIIGRESPQVSYFREIQVTTPAQLKTMPLRA